VLQWREWVDDGVSTCVSLAAIVTEQSQSKSNVLWQHIPSG